MQGMNIQHGGQVYSAETTDQLERLCHHLNQGQTQAAVFFFGGAMPRSLDPIPHRSRWRVDPWTVGVVAFMVALSAAGVSAWRAILPIAGVAVLGTSAALAVFAGWMALARRVKRRTQMWASLDREPFGSGKRRKVMSCYASLLDLPCVARLLTPNSQGNHDIAW